MQSNPGSSTRRTSDCAAPGASPTAPGATAGFSSPARPLVEDAEDNDEVRCLASHLSLPPPELPNLPLYVLPDEAYLEATVLPLLLRGLEELAKHRPPDPLAFLAAYLLNSNPQRSAVPLLQRVDGRKVPLMELAQKAACHYDMMTSNTAINTTATATANPIGADSRTATTILAPPTAGK